MSIKFRSFLIWIQSHSLIYGSFQKNSLAIAVLRILTKCNDAMLCKSDLFAFFV